jgi:hypothetical protein
MFRAITLLGAGLLIARGVAAQPGGLLTSTTTFHLCVQHDDGVSHAWNQDLAAGITRLVSGVYRNAGQDIRFIIDPSMECVHQAGAACHGSSGHVYCGEEALSRVLYASALASASFAAGLLKHPAKETGGALPVDFSFSMVECLAIADTAGRSKTMPDWIAARIASDPSGQLTAIFAITGRVAHAVHDFDVDPNASFPQELIVATAYNTYEAAANEILAFILGHELAHAQGRCVIDKPSWAERSGAFKQMTDLQSSGRMCSKDIDPDEMLADRCGLRVLETMDQAMIDFKVSHAAPWAQNPAKNVALTVLSVGRRIAIDGISWIFSIGMAARVPEAVSFAPPGLDGIPTLSYASTPRPGYLYEPLRLSLVAGVMRAQEQFNHHLVMLCDNTAQRFVLGLNSAGTACTGRNEASMLAAQKTFPAIFGELVSKEVSRRWSSGAWEHADADGVFNCPRSAQDVTPTARADAGTVELK